MKHWQLFVLLVGLPLLFDMVMVVLIILSIINKDTRSVFPIFPGIMLVVIFLCTGSFFAWLYTLGTSLYKKLPDNATMSLITFKIFFFIPVLYILSLSAWIAVTFTHVSPENPPSPLIFLLIIPLHLFSMFCIFYCLYFVAKTLKAVEWQKPVTFSDYIGEFFLLWFYFIGVWFIQPRINKLFAPAPET